ncbi:MAG: acyl-CoA dehydrogenase [Pseudonocardiales bacterium]|nr:acyl-CoA dehydrogenase [Pseudonocardiales bacterium]
MLTELAEFDQFTLRHGDYDPSVDQRDLADSYARLLDDYAPFTRVRAVERDASRFDHDLWKRLAVLGVRTFALPETAGGDGGSLSDAIVVAEQIGRSASSVALAETVAVGRLLARLGTPSATELLAGLRDGGALYALALSPLPAPSGDGRQLIPCGSVADAVVGLVGDDLLVWTVAARREVPDNLASAPLAWWELNPVQGRVLATGPTARVEYERVRREWRLLNAAHLVGLAHTTLQDALAYANDRRAFGLPIGSYQAVSHPLVDVHLSVVGARRLVGKAAWYEDYEPGAARELSLAAISFATDTAQSATSVGVHTLGGLGVTEDANMQLLFRRAQGWALFNGDPMGELADVIAGSLAADGRAVDG